MASVKATIANFSATPTSGYVAPGESISVSFKITNTGAYVIHGLTVTVWPEDGGIWGHIYQNAGFNLAKSASRTVTIHVPMPGAPQSVNRTKPNMDVYIYYETFSDFDPAKDTATGGQFVRLPFMGLDMRYDPKIPRFSFERYPAEESEGGRGTIACTLAEGANASNAGLSLKLQWKEEGAGEFPLQNGMDLPLASALSPAGATVSPAFSFVPGKAYVLRATLTDGFDTAFSEVVLPKSFMNLHLSGCGKGVALGQYSTSSEEAPKFECQYPAHFYGGIPQLDCAAEEVNTGIRFLGKPVFSKVIVHTVAASSDGDVPHGVAGWERLWIDPSGTFFASTSNAYIYPSGYVNASGTRMFACMPRSGSNNLYLITTGGGTCYMRILYTKA